MAAAYPPRARRRRTGACRRGARPRSTGLPTSRRAYEPVTSRHPASPLPTVRRSRWRVRETAQVARGEQRGAAAPREHVLGVLVLPVVAFEVRAVGAVPVAGEHGPDVVDHVEWPAPERDRVPRGHRTDAQLDLVAGGHHV